MKTKTTSKPYLRRAGEYWIFEMKIKGRTQHIAGRFSTRYLLEKVLGKEKAYLFYADFDKKKRQDNPQKCVYELLSESLKQQEMDTPIIQISEEDKKRLWELTK